MAQDEGAPYRDQARRLAELDWPILEASAAAFSQPDALVQHSLRELGQWAERDPGLVLRLVLRANGSRRGLRQEVHSVPDAIAMLGLQNVCDEVRAAPPVGEVVRETQHYRHVAAQSRLAAMIAADVARRRRDSEPAEVSLAASLNQLGLLGLLVAGEPRLERLLAMLELNALPDEASYTALGYATDDLSRAMTEAMVLPELVVGTQRAVNAAHPRAFEVMVASAVAWQIMRGMDTVRGDRDMRLLAGLTGVNEKVVADRLSEIIERFNEDIDVYRIEPLDPATPGAVWLGARHRTRLALCPRADILEDGLARLRQGDDRVARLRRMLRVMQFGLGLNRVVFARLARDGESLRAEHLVGTLHEPEFSHFVIQRSALGALEAVLERDTPTWWGRHYPSVALPEAIQALTGGVDGFYAPVRERGEVIGMVYADRRSRQHGLDDRAFKGFCRVVQAISGTG
ncbi:putative signal transduction protein [Thioalkalivibrio sp. K90mix]|uniref:HDOD domain-containing protein n=1 Tax=unclassified Thioalkalivibrio TaxID=2621013 RepID=UPI000195A5AD|nr:MULTISPECIES: HDOD domain-containing protein [unclassified Thioalkalivibrio]ADC71094.1 putative signal transduction protein [Thioalkalivibrio sp. K90mix]